MTQAKRKQLHKRIGHYFCYTWRTNFYFCLGFSEKDMKAYMLDSFQHETEFGSANGRCFECRNNDHSIYIIWTRKKTDYGSLMHECIHAAGMALDQRGWKYDADNDEPLTYLAQTIFEQAVKK